MLKRTAVLLAVLALLGACGSSDNGQVTKPTDPYETYLQLKPSGEETLSREDAQTRAMLGCDQTWAPGTTDRALADAYRPTGICKK